MVANLPRLSMSNNLAFVALAVMLIIASPFGMFGVVLGWVLLLIAAVLGLIGQA